MKASVIMLAAAIVILIVGIIVDGLPGVLITAVANILSATVMIRELRRKPEGSKETPEN